MSPLKPVLSIVINGFLNILNAKPLRFAAVVRKKSTQKKSLFIVLLVQKYFLYGHQTLRSILISIVFLHYYFRLLTYTNTSTLMGATKWVRLLLLLKFFEHTVFYRHHTTQKIYLHHHHPNDQHHHHNSHRTTYIPPPL